MEVEIFLAGRILHAHGDADLGGFDRTCAQHREFLEHDLQLGIALHQFHHVEHRALAVAAIVIEELDEGDVAVLVAERHVARRVEDRIGVLGDAGLVLLGFGGGLPLGQFGHRLFEHLGMGDQVVPDDVLDVFALDIGEALRGSRQRRAARVMQTGDREQGGSKVTEQRHRQILRWRVPGPFT